MDATRRTARLAGLTYLLLAITSSFGLVCASLVRPEVEALARLIVAPALRFRLALVSDLIAHVCGILLVWLLYRLLAPVDRQRAGLMVILLLVTVPISFLIALDDVAARILLCSPESLPSLTEPQLHDLATVFLRLHIHGVFAVEIFWGLWLFPFALLVLRSRFLPRVLGALLLVAGCAYVAHSLVSLLFPGHRNAAYELATMIARGAGELPMILWLLLKGVGVDRRTIGPPPAGESGTRAAIRRAPAP